MLSNKEEETLNHALDNILELKKYCSVVKKEPNTYAFEVFIELADNAISSLEILKQHKIKIKEKNNASYTKF